jgi:capsular polysaccharide biosynthesis protein
MELKDYTTIIRKGLPLLIISATAFGLLAFFISQKLPTTYAASLTLFVKRQAAEANPDYYTFDGYYSQQAAEKFTETVVGFLQSKDILLASAKLADLPTDQKTLEQLESSIKIKQVAPQLVWLKVEQENGEEAKEFCTALAQATTERINLLNQTGDKAISVDLLNPEPLVEKSEPKVVLNSLVGGLVGALLAFLYIFLKEYLES